MENKHLVYIILAVLVIGIAGTAFNYYKNAAAKDTGGETDIPVTENSSYTGFERFTTYDLNKEEVTEEILKGHKVNLINIWATYCKPCIAEMPDLEALDKEYGETVQVIGICIDVADASGKIDEDLLEQAKDIAWNVTKVSYPVLIPSKELLKGVLADIFAVPISFITDENGNVLESFMGRKSKEDLKKLIDKYL